MILAGNLRSSQMIYKLLPLFALLTQLAGCSTFIAESGKDLSQLKTREQVHAVFNCPDSNGVNKEGSYDSFRTRMKVAEEARSRRMGFAIAMTHGVTELAFFPIELWRFGRTIVIGQELEFQYDSSDKITQIRLNGERLSFDEGAFLNEVEVATAKNDR